MSNERTEAQLIVRRWVCGAGALAGVFLFYGLAAYVLRDDADLFANIILTPITGMFAVAGFAITGSMRLEPYDRNSVGDVVVVRVGSWVIFGCAAALAFMALVFPWVVTAS